MRQCTVVWMGYVQNQHTTDIVHIHLTPPPHPQTHGRHNALVGLESLICLSTSQRVTRKTRHALPAIKSIEKSNGDGRAVQWWIMKEIIKLKASLLHLTAQEEAMIARLRFGACFIDTLDVGFIRCIYQDSHPRTHAHM